VCYLSVDVGPGLIDSALGVDAREAEAITDELDSEAECFQRLLEEGWVFVSEFYGDCSDLIARRRVTLPFYFVA
jgi:hypothetical protein